MPKITMEELLSNMEFKCARCGAECVKVEPSEPLLFYVSKIDGEPVGPLCTSCFETVPENDRVVQKILASAFIVAIKADGEGYAILQQGIEIPYSRDPTVFEIKAACQEIIDDLSGAKLVTKLSHQLKAAHPVASSTVPLLKRR